MLVRKSVTALTAQEKSDLVAAIKTMKASGTYDTYVLQHSRAMQTPTPPNVSPNVRNVAHRGPAFGPWHREFIRRFEADLGVPLPYWDWAADQAAGSPETAAVWGPDLMGGNGVPPDHRVTDGPFAHDPADPTSWSTVPDPSLPAALADPTVPWLTRNFGSMQPTLPVPQDVIDALNIDVYDAAPWDTTSQPSFRNTLEGFIGPGLHNAAHMWVGGSMMPTTSPNDPVFFLHHANVDRIWANWQRRYYGLHDYLPTGAPSAIVGPTGHNLRDVMSPWGAGTTPASVLDTFALGYWYDDAPSPSVTGPTPATGAGSGGTVVAISGTGFTGATGVDFGGTAAAAFTVDSDTQITVTSPAGAGTIDIIVTTPVGASAVDPADQFTYMAAAAAPAVTALNPGMGAAAGGDSIVISGTGFTGATGVDFGGTAAAAFTVDSDTQITATSPAGAGTIDIIVTTPVGASAVDPADQFTYM